MDEHDVQLAVKTSYILLQIIHIYGTTSFFCASVKKVTCVFLKERVRDQEKYSDWTN